MTIKKLAVQVSVFALWNFQLVVVRKVFPAFQRVFFKNLRSCNLPQFRDLTVDLFPTFSKSFQNFVIADLKLVGGFCYITSSENYDSFQPQGGSSKTGLVGEGVRMIVRQFPVFAVLIILEGTDTFLSRCREVEENCQHLITRLFFFRVYAVLV